MQEGYQDCVVMLVKGYPDLLKYMLSLVMKEDMPEEQVRKVGLHLDQPDTRNLHSFTSLITVRICAPAPHSLSWLVP